MEGTLKNTMFASKSWHNIVSLAIFFFFLSCCVKAERAIGESASTRSPLPNFFDDAAVRDCHCASNDRWWCCGDRGLLKVSEDAGQTWQQLAIAVDDDLYQFSSYGVRNGIVVGGHVKPGSRISVGIILSTFDGGRRWQVVSTPQLPRLLGARAFDAYHWVVWGDWSAEYGSSVLITEDGGKNWRGIAEIGGHVQSAVWRDLDHGMIVDRLGRVCNYDAHRTLEWEQLPNVHPASLLAIAENDYGVWIVGERASVYFKPTNQEWIKVEVPGTSEDDELISFRDLAVRGRSVCLVGSPGNVVWESENLGQSWNVHSLPQSLPVNSIAYATDENLFAGGEFGTLLASRNSSKGWWLTDGRGEGVGILHLVQSVEALPLDAMIFTALESEQRTASLIANSTHFDQHSSPWVEDDVFLSNMLRGNSLGAVDFIELSDRHTDAANEIDIQKLQSSIQRKLILAIRQWKPKSTIVSVASISDVDQSRLMSRAVTSLHRAGDARFRLFSEESGIPNTVWDCSFALARTTNDAKEGKKRGEFTLTSNTPLHRYGILLGDLVSTIQHGQVASMPLASFSSTLDVNDDSRSSSASHYRAVIGKYEERAGVSMLPDEHEAAKTLRTKARRSPESKSLIATAVKCEQAWIKFAENQTAKEQDDNVRSDNIDARWFRELGQLINVTPSPLLANKLSRLAEHYRRQGCILKYRACVEQLAQRSSANGLTELNVIGYSSWHASEEYKKFIAQAHGLSHQTTTEESEVASATYTQLTSSPFISTHDTKRSNHASSVQTASHSSSMKTETSRSVAQLASPSLAVEPLSAALITTCIRTDPRMILSEIVNSTSEHSDQLGKGIRSSQAAVATVETAGYSPPQKQPAWFRRYTKSETLNKFQFLYAWDNLRLIEHATATSMSGSRGGSTLPLPNIAFQSTRPVLDGKLSDTFWRKSTAIQLVNPFECRVNPNDFFETQKNSDEPTQKSFCDYVRVGRDSRFLYIATTLSHCPANRSSRNQSEKAKDSSRVHDRLVDGEDRFVFRIDTDRDYLTWFEFSVDSQGNLSEAINDINAWNPKWFAATSADENVWTAEIAIPLQELFSDRQQETLETQGEMIVHCDFRRMSTRGSQIKSDTSCTEMYWPFTWSPLVLK